MVDEGEDVPTFRLTSIEEKRRIGVSDDAGGGGDRNSQSIVVSFFKIN